MLVMLNLEEISVRVTAGVNVLLKTVVRPQSRLVLEQCMRIGNSLGRHVL